MHSPYLYAVVALCLVLGLIFTAGLPIVDALLARSGYRQMTLLERVCFAVVLTVVLLASAGVIVSISPWSYRRAIASVMIAGMAFAGLCFHYRRKKVGQSEFVAQRTDLLFLGTFICFAAICLALSLAKYRLPADLPDGAYVNKEHVTAVSIQKYTGNLPADNVVPYVASEYLLRGVSFKDNHPMLPGQAVTNRPILVSLVAAPIRAALAMPSLISERLPTFSYVGTEWPDFRIFVRDEVGFAIFLAVAITLNASLLLAAGAIAVRCFQLSTLSSLTFSALFVSSPYFIFQTLFTWPKALAAFFILCALLALLVYRAYPLVGALLGLAYWSHPFAIAYIGVFMLFVGLIPSLAGNRMKAAAQTFISVVAVILPWFLWSKFVVALDSDLVTQNFRVSGQTLKDFIWVRVVNLSSTLQTPYLMHYPFDIRSYVTQASANAVGALGIIPALFFLPACRLLHENRQASIAIAITGLSAILLTLVFSNLAVPALHGFQAFLPLVLLLAIKHAEQYRLAIRSLLYLQVAANFVAIFLYTAALRA